MKTKNKYILFFEVEAILSGVLVSTVIYEILSRPNGIFITKIEAYDAIDQDENNVLIRIGYTVLCSSLPHSTLNEEINDTIRYLQDAFGVEDIKVNNRHFISEEL